jgi:hypothetical protein
MPKKSSRDLEALYIQTLAQSVAEKEKEISDYACNAFADKIAQINIIEMMLDEEKDADLIEQLEALKMTYKELGTALWFMNAGELSNLGARLGSTVKEYSLKGRKDVSNP